MEDEIWKDIPSFIGFLQASNLGRIREYIVVKANGFPDIVYKNRILKIIECNTEPYIAKINYNGKVYYAARLIAEAFLKDFERKKIVGFKDGNNKNIRPDNLKIQKAPGISAKGYNNWQAKLNDEKILEIVELIKKGYSARTIAKKYDIHWQNVYRIAYKKIWKHVERPILQFVNERQKSKRNKN